MKIIPLGKDKEMRYLMNKQEQLKENIIKLLNILIFLTIYFSI